MTPEWQNTLYFGDNLPILRRHLADESVDLIYLDPPFNSKASYNVLFKEQDGTQAAAQITAFDDFWHWDMEAAGAFHEVVTKGPPKVSELLQSLHSFLGCNDMMAYLTMMAIRLVEMRRVLKDTGSIYLHCDPTASHYLKIVMDAVFGAERFRNEIVWRRTSGHSDALRCGNVHDTILFFGKGDKPVWNQVHQTYAPGYEEQYYRFVDEDGRRFKSGDLSASGLQGGGYEYEWNGHTKVWRCPIETMQRLHDEGRIYYTKRGVPRLKGYLDEAKGMPIQDIWDDILPLRSWHQERLGYPTQKPEALLERIIQASSNEGDLVLDPFCGCGTTVAVAERLHRRWIGIDITHLAISLMRTRLRDTFGPDLNPYQVIGEPQDLESARALAEENRYQFEYWALGLVGARPAQDKKKGADRGVDGIITFIDDAKAKPKKIVLQVKSGRVNRSVIAALKGDIEREQAQIGALLTLEEPTVPMRSEAANAGFYQPPGLQEAVPRLQVLTIGELLDGKQIQYPHVGAATFKRAARQTKPKPKGKEPEDLFGGE